MKIDFGSTGMGMLEPQECDIVDAATDEKLHTIKLALVPRVGEELDVDAGSRDRRDGVYRIVRIRYHVKCRRIVKTDDLIGISLYVERCM